jgi:pimeloyl-ACP methyl ester carboxylesterase
MAHGGDPPVLLVHGFASSAEHNWRHPGWLDLLADCGRETIAVDLPGHGTAPKPADPASYQKVEAHVAAAVQGREPLDAIGFSAGAHVLLRLADGPGNDRAALVAFLRRPQRPLTPADLARVTAQVLVVLGDQDPAGTLTRGDGLVAALPDARLVTLRGVDHFGTPADVRCMQAVLGFLGC